MIKPVCPHDQTPLRHQYVHGLPRYACGTCDGFSVNFGATKLILSSAETAALWDQANRSPRGSTPCTHCRLPMNVVAPPPGLDQPELDFCPRCHVLWFDRGEWAHAKGRASFTQSHRPAMTQSLERQRADAILALDVSREAAKLPSSELTEVLPTYKLALSFIGLPTEEQADSFATNPLATWTLIALCVLATLWFGMHQDFAIAHFAFRAGLPFAHALPRALTSFFLHGGPMHILGNAYFLWIFGDNCEDELGKLRYLGLLACATLAGCFAFAWFAPHAADTPLIGASAGISGVIAFYLVSFRHRRFVIRAWLRPIAIPGFVFGALYFTKDVVGAYVQVYGHTAVSHVSHLGGAAVGLGYGLWWANRYNW